MSAQGKKGKGGGAGGRTPTTPTTPKQTQQQQPQPAAPQPAAAAAAVVTAAATPSVASAVPAAAAPASAAGGAAAAAAAPTSASASVSSFVPMLPPASQLLPGASVRVRTSLQSDPFDGVLFVYDAAANLLVVERAYDFADERNYNTRADAADQQNQPGEGKKDYAILNAKCVRVELVAPAPAKPRALPPLSMEAINTKAVAGQQERMEEMSSIGVGVTPEGQKLFDAVRKTTPCVWRDQSFLVMDCVRVPPPYTVAACHIVPQQQQQQQQGQGRRGNSNAQTAAQAAAAEVMLARVRKIVDAERIKLKLTNTQ